ncbi:MAG TPA: ABC transporter substrate-binding protein [Candidatus Krumholzibacteria bacterium]
MGKVRRRQLLIAAGGLLVGAAFLCSAQPAKVYRVGLVTLSGPEGRAYRDTFLGAMHGLGYVEGTNIVFDIREAGAAAQVPGLVDELIALNPDVLVGWESVVQVMRAKTASIPLVLTGAVDPVKAGLAQSLRRPGMNVTGSAQLNDVLPAKHIEIARQIIPRLVRVGQLVDTTASGCKLIEARAREAAHSFGAVLTPYYVASREDIERAFSRMESERPDVLLPCPSSVLFAHRDLLFENVLRLRIPLTSYVVANVPAGVLFAYAASIHEGNRKAATYVDRILKGAKPGELPIEQPTNLELVVNLKTAQALKLAIPPAILLRADRVIE